MNKQGDTPLLLTNEIYFQIESFCPAIEPTCKIKRQDPSINTHTLITYFNFSACFSSELTNQKKT